jgi:MoxR-like ATPase
METPKNRSAELIEALRWAGREVGRHLSYPQYDNWLEKTQLAYFHEHGETLDLPSSRTLRKHLGNGKWPAAKVAAGLITADEAEAGVTWLSRSDEETLDRVAAVLTDNVEVSRVAYRAARRRWRQAARAAGADDWVPEVDALLGRFGGTGRAWDVVLETVRSHIARRPGAATRAPVGRAYR